MNFQPTHTKNKEDTMSTDESMVAALDTQYQEAVKNNDEFATRIPNRNPSGRGLASGLFIT